MNVNELNYKEQALIEILRSFNFLYDLGYHESELTYAGRGNPSLVYENNSINRKVLVIGDETEVWTILIQRKNLFASKEQTVFDISDYFKEFNSGMIKGKSYTFNSLTDFIKTNLIPVINGSKWITDII